MPLRDEALALEPVEQPRDPGRCQPEPLRQIDPPHRAALRPGEQEQRLVPDDRQPVLRLKLEIERPAHRRLAAQEPDPDRHGGFGNYLWCQYLTRQSFVVQLLA